MENQNQLPVIEPEQGEQKIEEYNLLSRQDKTMIYLISQIAFHTTLAFIIGIFVGWAMKKQSTIGKEENLTLRWKQRLNVIENEREKLQKELDVIRNGDHSSPVPPLSPVKTVEKRSVEIKSGVEIKSISIITPDLAQKLSEIDIKTATDLIERCSTKERQKEVANLLRVENHIIANWIVVAELMNVPGVKATDSALLNKTGVNSIEELANKTPQILSNQMAQANQVDKLTQETPAPEVVANWISAAKVAVADKVKTKGAP